MEVRLVQPVKAFCAMEVTVAGILTEVRLGQFRNMGEVVLSGVLLSGAVLPEVVVDV